MNEDISKIKTEFPKTQLKIIPQNLRILTDI